MTRPTTRGVALLAVGVGAYVAARVLGTWELYLVALAFAAMTVLAWSMVLAGSRRLQIDRRVAPERPVAGDLLEFTFRVRGGWRLPGLQITLADATGDLGRSSDPIVLDEPGGAGERTVTAGPWPARRGVHRLPEFWAVVEDPLGLVRARRLAGEPQRVTVVPRLVELESCAACVDSGVRHGGGRGRLPTRDAWEFRGIRPHDPGEPLNRVDWKATAKTGDLMLREMEAASEDDLTVLLSGAPGRDAGKPPHTPFETAVRAAGSMAAFTLRGGHAVSLLLPEQDWRPVRLTPDAASRRKLLGALAQAEPTGAARLGPSLSAIIGGRRQMRRRVLALVVLRLDADLAGALLKLRRQGIAVSVVHVAADAADDAGATGGGEAGDVSRTLVAAGVRYVRLARGDDLRTALATTPARRTVGVG